MICPHCETHTKRIKDNLCPSCSKRVYKHKGQLYKEPPIAAIIQVFESIMTVALSKDKDFPVPYKIPIKGVRYRAEQRTAAQLLQEAEGNLALLVEAMYWLAGSKKYGWRINSSLRNFLPIINVGLSVIDSWEQEKTKREERSKLFDDYYRSIQEELS